LNARTTSRSYLIMRAFIGLTCAGWLGAAAILGGCTAQGIASTGQSASGASAALATPSVPAEEPSTYAGGPLAPGWYRTSQLDPAMAFRIDGEGWHALFDEDPAGGFALDFNGSDPFVGLARVPQVIDPATGTLGDVPDDLVAWLLAHPRLEAREITDRSSLAGLPVRVVEYTTTGGDVTLYYHPGGNFHLGPGLTMREYVMPLDGPDLVVTAVLGRDPVAGEAAIEPLLDSLQILP
jgi:hypothetical protein